MTRADDAVLLARLRSLGGSPEEQAALAVRLVEKSRAVDAVVAALKVLAERPEPRHQRLLVQRYVFYDRDGAHRDPGGAVRSAILGVLRQLALPEDAALFERAVTTYEFRFGEVTGDLRAAGLLALNEVDQTRAGFHAVRLLTDRYTSPMSGEPALTAARVLAAQGQMLPLYAYVLQEGPGVADVVAECLRSLTAMPASLLPSVVERFQESDDEIVLLGLFDLLLGHAARDQYQEFIVAFLRTTRLSTIHRYLASAIVAGRDEALIAELVALEKVERDPRKREALRAALALR